MQSYPAAQERRSAFAETRDLSGTGAQRIPPRTAHDPHLAGVAAAAEESVAAVGFESRYHRSRRHIERLQHLPAARIDVADVALVAFPGAVPEFPVHPGDAGDVAVSVDRAQNGTGVRVDLVDFPLPILPYPQRAFRPRQPRITAVAGRGNRGDHPSALRVDFLDMTLCDLEQVMPVERRARVRGDVDGAQGFSALRIERVQSVAGGEPDVPPVVSDAVDLFGVRKRAVLVDDFSSGSFHGLVLIVTELILVARQRSGE